MTKNFKMMLDYKLTKRHDEIIHFIDKIEECIFENKFEDIFSDGRKILDIIFSNFYNDNLFFHLNEKISDYIDKNAVSSKVKNAFFTVKRKGNENSHAIKVSDIPYKIETDIYTVIEFLKQLYIVIKYFIIHLNSLNEDDYKDYNFNSEVYISNSPVKNDIPKISKEDIYANSSSLISETKGIFEIICSEYDFLIPTYQRSYTWNEDNVNVLLNDIKDRMEDKETHYTGSLAISVDRENKLLRLIDGQQRITTSLLLLKAIIIRYEKNNTMKMPKELVDLDKIINEKYINRIKYGDISTVKKVLIGQDSFKDSEFIKSNAYKNFKVISHFLEEMNDSEIEEFYTTFVYKFVVAELKFNSDLKNEIQIFENLNSKGMELFQWDLIKNYIYKNIKTDLLIAREDDIQSLLNKFFISPSLKYFKSKNFDELSNFFIFYCRIKYKKIFNSPLDKKGKINKIFSDIWPEKSTLGSIDSIQKLEKSLKEISRMFKIYCELKSGEYKMKTSFLFDFKLPIENTSMKNVHYPLIINVIHSNSDFNDSNEIIKISNKEKILSYFNDIEKYIIRLIVVSNKAQSLPLFFDELISSNLDNSYNLFIDKIRETGKQTSLPVFDNFVRELIQKNDWQEKYAVSILKRLYVKTFFENGDDENFSNYFLEQIMPKEIKVSSKWRTQYDDMDINSFREKHNLFLNKLGNYVILTKKIKTVYKNMDFLEKIEYYKKDNSFKKLINNNQVNLVDLIEKKSFKFNDIEKRTLELVNLITPLYKFYFEK